MTKRKRTCATCSKPLGNTVYECHDCGGEDVSDEYGSLVLLASQDSTVGSDVTYRGGQPSNEEADHEHKR